MPAGNGETRIQRIFTQGDAHTGSRRVRRQFSFSPLFPGDSAPPRGTAVIFHAKYPSPPVLNEKHRPMIYI